jgi:hypothetical protein
MCGVARKFAIDDGRRTHATIIGSALLGDRVRFAMFLVEFVPERRQTRVKVKFSALLFRTFQKAALHPTCGGVELHAFDEFFALRRKGGDPEDRG